MPSTNTTNTGGGAAFVGGAQVKGNLVGRDSYTFIYSNPEPTTTLKEGIPRQVIPPMDDYIPRESLETKLTKELSTSPPLLFVQGLQGTGKFYLLRNVVNTQAIEEKFPDGTLYCELNGRSISDVLYRLIQAFEPDFKFNSKLSVSDYYQKAKTVFEEKKVLILARKVTSPDILKHIQFGHLGVTVVVISHQRFPNYEKVAKFVEVPEMSQDEAIALLKKNLDGYANSLQCDETFFKNLSKELHYTPAKMKMATEMIRQMKYNPAEYLDELIQSKENNEIGESEWNHFNTYLENVYQSLPVKSQQILPFLGVFGTGYVTASAIAAISRQSRQDVIQALEQMERFDLVQEIYSSEPLIEMDNPFGVSDRVRDFALIKLKELIGSNAESSIQTLRALMANYYLGRAADLLDQGKWKFLNAFRKRIDENSNLALSEAITTFKHIDISFDHILINNQNASELWSRFFIREEIKNLRTHLEEAFDWAITQEDWRLVQRFFKVNLRGVYSFSNNNEKNRAKTEIDSVPNQEVHLSRRRFVHIHDFNLTNQKVYGFDLKAVRLLGSEIRKSSLDFCRLFGVQIQNADWEDVDIVGIEAPALNLINSRWVGVDARMADLRGAKFDGCYFENVDFRGSQLAGAIFHDCKLVNCDFRRKSEKPIYISEDTAIADNVRGI